ncbi:MAG: hypothetical protein R6U54_02930 [Candidatus Omnitrophota bacterium]
MDSQTPADIQSASLSSPNQLQELLADLAVANICPRIKKHFLTLTGEGMSLVRGTEPAIGNLWIQDCATRGSQPGYFDLIIEGAGWRWIDREATRLGATFYIDEYVRFEFRLVMSCQPKIQYDRENHTAVVWFKPVKPLDIAFTVMGTTNVRRENFWTSLVGAVAALFGASSEERAEKMIEQKFEEKFKSKFDRGITLLLDLCTGQHDILFGTYSAGEMPKAPLPSQGHRYYANKRAVLRPGSLFLSGPFWKDKEMTAFLKVTQGRVKAAWMCDVQAVRLATAYMDQSPLPEVSTLKEATYTQDGHLETFSDDSKESDCPVVFVMQSSSDHQASRTDYFLTDRKKKKEPLIRCPDKSKQIEKD